MSEPRDNRKLEAPTAPGGCSLARVWAGLFLGVLLLAAWARLAPWQAVFRPGGVELLPTDTHYYVRFALRLLHAFPRFDGFDPFVNAPGGAPIYWPPLHAYGVAASIALLGPARGPAFVDPFFSLVELALLLSWARRRLGEARALGLGVLLALIPAVVDQGILGCADHHVHEPMFAAALVLAVEMALNGERRGALWAGLLLGGSRLFTTATVVFVGPVAAAIALCGLLAKDREEARTLGVAGLRIAASAAGILWVSALLFGQVASLQYALLSSFTPLVCLGVVGGASALALLRARDRLTWVALGAGLSLLALVPSLRTAGHDLGRGDPVLAMVAESLPLFGDLRGAFSFFDLALFLLPLALLGAARALRRERLAAISIAFTLPMLVAAGMQARMARPCAGAMAVLIVCGLPWLLPASGRPRRIALALFAFLGLLLVRTALRPVDRSESDEDRLRATLFWVRDHTPAPADPLGDQPAPYAVVANFNFGHLITLWAERAAVATPFSQTPWHLAGNARASAVLAATDDEQAYQAMQATAARYLLATPFNGIPGVPLADDRRTIARRLLDGAGMEDAFGPAYGHFRLLHDSAEQRQRKEGGVFARVFEAVRGAQFVGRAAPGARIIAELTLLDRGQPLHYRRETTADAQGRFRLRVAYATEGKGELQAVGDYRLDIGGASGQVAVGDRAVELGEEVLLPAELADFR